MGDNVENRQPTSESCDATSSSATSSGATSRSAASCDTTSSSAARSGATRSGATSREVSGQQDLLTPFFTPQEGGERRSGVYKRRILHDHNTEVPPMKRGKRSEIYKMNETKTVDVLGEDTTLDSMASKLYKTASNALEPYIRYMLRSWADVSSKHPGMAKSSIPLKWLGSIGGKREQSEVSIGDIAGKTGEEIGGRKGVHRREVEGNIRCKCYTDWAQVAVESRKKQLTAASVKRKSVQSIDAGGLDSVGSVGKPVDAGASSSIESEYINRTNLDTAFIGTAHSNVEEEDVDGFLFQASKTMFPLEEVVHNQLAEVDDEELHNLEARFGIEVLSFKEAKRVVSWWESRRALHLKQQ